MQHQCYNGKKFYLDKRTGYWISTKCPKIRMHVYVWKHHNGNPLSGFHIHHIDGDRGNNHISNLQCINAREHFAIHMTEIRKENLRERIDVIRPLTKEWHSSQKGRDWHSAHAKITFNRRLPIDLRCKYCDKTYCVDVLDENRSKFCSNKCKSAARRHSGVDNVQRECIKCSKPFEVNKYGKRRYCTRSCAQKDYWDKKKRQKESLLS